MEKHLIDTLHNGEMASSTYAEIYLDDDYCGYKKPVPAVADVTEKRRKDKRVKEDGESVIKEPQDDWTSPSDLLIGKVYLYPPFTSKIFRGQTHAGILAIGEQVLQKERDKFMKYLDRLIQDNEAAWAHIEEQEKAEVVKKVKAIYEKIFQKKSKVMQQEIVEFFETSLQELEDNVRQEVKTALLDAHCHMISELNIDTQNKMKKEKNILQKVLQKRYDGEIFKLKRYYKLLLENEKHRYNAMLNNVICQRNDALKAFYNRIEAENFTSAMYVMCTERKKCRIKRFLLENIQTTEITEKSKRIKEKKEIIDDLTRNKTPLCQLNTQWEEKVKKILKLFLKFISFCLRLLPEQSTFLLDLEKLLVLQLNEIQKNPTSRTSILIYEKELWNVFKFEKESTTEPLRDCKPFEVEGDLATDTHTPYGSRETLPSHTDLPFVRLGRQFIYAKCQRMEEVKAFLESQRCKCHDRQPKAYPAEPEPISSSEPTMTQPSPSMKKSSTELFMVDDIGRLDGCPVRACQDWANRESFPYLNSYLDFSEANYTRVQTLIGKHKPLAPRPEVIKAHDIVYQDLRFSATKEKSHDVETQYSSQEDLANEFFNMPTTCPCMDDISEKLTKALNIPTSTKSLDTDELVMKRRISIRRLIQNNPKLLKMLTDESFDFVM